MLLVGLGIPGSGFAEPIELDCLIAPRSEITVSAPVEGVVETVLVDRGDFVEPGQVLATLEADVEKAALEAARVRARAESAFKRNHVRLGFAERVLERSRRLEEGGIVSQRERDEAESEKAIAEAGLLEAREARLLAEADLLRAEQIVEQRTIRSPVKGVIVERLLSPGDLADPPQLVKVVEIDPLYVEIFAPRSLWGRVSIGATGEVIPEEPVGGAYEARVTAVDPVIDAASGMFRVRLELPNPAYRIPAGLSCRVRFREGS